MFAFGQKMNFFRFQIVGLDQFMTSPCHLGRLNHIHVDMVISNLNTVYQIYPLLLKKPVHIFVEANLSHDLSAFVQIRLRKYYNLFLRHVADVRFARQHDCEGRLLPGILTRHKANMVSYFKRALDENRIYVACQIATVSRIVELKYAREDPSFDTNDVTMYGVGGDSPTISDMSVTLKTFIDQATNFRCYLRGNSTVYSGKRSGKDAAKVDDLVMAVIISIAWARLPEHTYALEG